MNIIFQTWPWYISGFLIGMIMLSLLILEKHLGCLLIYVLYVLYGRLGERSLFDFDWKAQRWNLVVVVGAMLGGFIAVHFMGDPQMLL
jgi:hypothetical protein